MTPAASATTVARDHGFHLLTVKKVLRETPDTRSFTLEVPEALRPSFAYRPGQFCTFRVRLEGVDHLRSYSMSSAPETDPDLTVTVKRVPGGLISNWLNDRVGEGDRLEVTRPAGVFCPRPTDRPLLAFCGGSGITPVLSITKSVLATTRRRVLLVYANRDRRSVIFGDVLGSLQARFPDRLEVHHHFDTDGGFLGPDDVARSAAIRPEADCYLCGPAPFMDLVETTLRRLGTDSERIFVERFLVEEQEKRAAGRLPDDAGDELPETLTLTLGGQTVSVPYRRGDTVLETARRGALRPPYSCESGNCATCMAVLRQGSATMRANNALTPEEVAEGWILTCQALPRGTAVAVEWEAL